MHCNHHRIAMPNIEGARIQQPALYLHTLARPVQGAALAPFWAQGSVCMGDLFHSPIAPSHTSGGCWNEWRITATVCASRDSDNEGDQVNASSSASIVSRPVQSCAIFPVS